MRFLNEHIDVIIFTNSIIIIVIINVRLPRSWLTMGDSSQVSRLAQLEQPRLGLKTSAWRLCYAGATVPAAKVASACGIWTAGDAALLSECPSCPLPPSSAYPPLS